MSHPTFDDFKRSALLEYLRESHALAGGNVAAMSRLTGLNRASLYKTCERYGFDCRKRERPGNAAWRELGY